MTHGRKAMHRPAHGGLARKAATATRGRASLP